MFVHVSTTASNVLNVDFFSFYKTAYFRMSVAQKPAITKATLSQVKHIQKRKLLDSSTIGPTILLYLLE